MQLLSSSQCDRLFVFTAETKPFHHHVMPVGRVSIGKPEHLIHTAVSDTDRIAATANPLVLANHDQRALAERVR